MIKEAMFYTKRDNKDIECNLCPHNCRIKPGNKGLCNVRCNNNGVLYAENYGKITSIALDPIEKKPLSFFMPKTFVLSIGTYGCNFKCPFCQNYSISQEESLCTFVEPQKIIQKALEEKLNGNIGIAYTYNEPVIWYEYVLDTAKLARENGLKNILVTNGYINKEPLLELLPYIDAMNIDLKAFNDNFYKKLCKGKLDPVKETIMLAYQYSHIELTTLIIPNENDDINEIESMLKWISEISSDIPLHFSRFFPRYKYNKAKPTEIDFLYNLKALGERYLNKVILGNI